MNWIEMHRARWAAKPALRLYYEHEIFDRIIPHLPPGLWLEIGAGPGFFSDYAGGVVATDCEFDRKISACADIHSLPFQSASFAGVVGIDVLHHLNAPATALAEVARVLQPGGRLVLIEPWAGPLGSIFYRYIHHESCAPVDDPLDAAFGGGKSPMDGNAWLPKAILADRQPELLARVPELEVREVKTFGALSYLLTGGFRAIGLPWWVVSMFIRIERRLPDAFLKATALRAIFVFDRIETAGPSQFTTRVQ